MDKQEEDQPLKRKDTGKPHKVVDSNKKSTEPVILLMNIETQSHILEVIIREDTNIQHLHEIVCLYGDFKTYNKKFKDIFLRYLKSMHQCHLTKRKMQIEPYQG